MALASPGGGETSAGPAESGPAESGPAECRPTGFRPPESRPDCASRAGPGESAENAPVLAAEQAHLRRSRECLQLMRENVLALPALGGNRVSQEYLKRDLYYRAQAMLDLPDTPLFFGRVDYAGRPPAPPDAQAEPAEDEESGSQFAGELFHIGRRHVHDPDGRPVVVDWRAPVSRPFYRASQGSPLGLELRRRFGFDGGDLTAFEDERFRPGGALAAVPAAQPGGAGAAGQPRETGAAPDGGLPASRILIEEIERPRSGPMRDIVATIQPDQDDIVRADVDRTVCVQGAPGTGKTAVGLHRIAYLLYAHRERLSRGGVLVIGPNQAFLAYIRNVLPALGEVGVTQVSVADLLSSVPVRGTDADQAAVLKGDARMAEVLGRALWLQLGAAEAVMLPRGSRRWRVPAAELDDLVDELRARGVRYGTGRELLSHRIAHVILTRMEAAGESCDDRTHEAVRRSRPVRAAVEQIWPKADPVRLVFRLLADPNLLASAAAGLLDPAEQAAVSWARPPRGPGSARWSAADAVLIDEARDLIERTPSLAHVVVDEAQDLSPMECRAIGRRCSTGTATVLGDLAQGTTPWAAANWPDLLGHLGKPEADLQVLDVGYRVPRQILDFAAALLPQIAPGLSAARSVRHDRGSLVIEPLRRSALASALASACADALARPGSAGVIAADDQLAKLAPMLAAAGLPHAMLGSETDGDRLSLVPVTLAKGLEFDQVIVVEPARIAGAEARGLHRLYVALTRAVSRLTVLHAESLPAPLAAVVPSR